MSLRNLLLIASLIVSVIIGLIIARGDGHAAGSGAKKRLVIGLSLDTLKEERWQGDRDRFVARCRELGAEVLVQSANSDDSVQMQNIEGLIANGVDALVIVPHDGKAMAKAVEKAKSVGIPVIAYDRLIRDCDLDLYCSFDNIEVGRQQARYLVKQLAALDDKNHTILRIYGAPTDNNAKLFKAGQDEILEPLIASGAISVVHADWAEDWKPENAKKIVSAAITKGVHFAGILASNDGTAGGAIQALSEEGLSGVIVTGQDAELAACQRIAGGSQAMTIYKPLSLLAASAAELAVAMAKRQVVVANATVDNGRKAVPAALFGVVTVTKANLLDTVIKDGFLAYDDVFRGIAAPPARPAK